MWNLARPSTRVSGADRRHGDLAPVIARPRGRAGAVKTAKRRSAAREVFEASERPFTRGAMVVRPGEGETKTVSFLLVMVGRKGPTVTQQSAAFALRASEGRRWICHARVE